MNEAPKPFRPDIPSFKARFLLCKTGVLQGGVPDRTTTPWVHPSGSSPQASFPPRGCAGSQGKGASGLDGR